MAALLTTSTSLTCMHGGTVIVVTSNTRALAGGEPVLLASDQFTIGDCPLNSPCTEVRWTPDAESSVLGDATLNEDSVGECLNASQATQGLVVIAGAQQRVRGR